MRIPERDVVLARRLAVTDLLGPPSRCRDSATKESAVGAIGEVSPGMCEHARLAPHPLSSDRPQAALYLELMKRVLTRYGFPDERNQAWKVAPLGWKRYVVDPVQRVLETFGMAVYRNPSRQAVNWDERRAGNDWPRSAETMIGLERLDNVQFCVETVLAESIDGDLVETGVWRGGAAIFMRALLAAHQDEHRRVWLADSFEGLPAPNVEKYPADKGYDLSRMPVLAVSVDEVRENFRRYDLLDDRVQFLVGWFNDTLPTAPIEKISVLRLDGDLYESTMDALDALYHRVSISGFIIIDDYKTWPPCKAAVTDFRERFDITDRIIDIDDHGVYWRRSS